MVVIEVFDCWGREEETVFTNFPVRGGALVAGWPGEGSPIKHTILLR